MKPSNAAFAEYARYIPVLEVVAAATDTSAFTSDDWEAYGEQVAEIANERALAGCGSTASSDAARIHRFQRVQRALRSYAAMAPAHADACADIAHGLDL